MDPAESARTAEAPAHENHADHRHRSLGGTGLLIGAVLLYIAARIVLAAVLFLLFAGVVIWAVAQRWRAQPLGGLSQT